jgi:hypothetical protein
MDVQLFALFSSDGSFSEEICDFSRGCSPHTAKEYEWSEDEFGNLIWPTLAP